MGKVYLKIPSWVSLMWQIKPGDWLSLEKEYHSGMKLKDLLSELVLYSSSFHTLVFRKLQVEDQLRRGLGQLER